MSITQDAERKEDKKLSNFLMNMAETSLALPYLPINNKTTLVLAKSKITDIGPVMGITRSNKFVEYAFSEVSSKS